MSHELRPVTYTNGPLFLAIAREAAQRAAAEFAAGRTPKEDGSGFVLHDDPDRRSFKDSLIAIVFCGLYLEARLHLEGTARLGDAYPEYGVYEVKLRSLGADDSLIAEAAAFRELRNQVVHEKATVTRKHLLAQDQAAIAIAFIERASAWLDALPAAPACGRRAP